MLKSLRLRLALWTIAAVAISLAMIWYALAGMFAGYVQERYQSEMSALAESIIAGVYYEGSEFRLDASPGDPRLELPAGGRYWQLNAIGQADIRSPSLWDTTIEPATMSDDESGFLRTVGPDGEDILVYTVTASLADNPGTDPGNFRVYSAFPKAEYSTAVSTFRGELTRMTVIAGLMLSLGGLILVVAGLAPLDRLRGRVAGVRSGDLRQIDETGPSEVRPLVREINELLAEREGAVERARARASDLAHGLKTPLTVLSQVAVDLPADIRDIVTKQVDLIRQRTDRQLQAARLGTEQMAVTDLSEIVAKLVQVLSPVSRANGIEWKNHIADRFFVGMDPADLAEALGNVMDNAAKWAESHVMLEATEVQHNIVVTISDDGPGVENEELQRVLQRGVHLDQPESATGLGLAITNDILIAYGGRVDLSRSTDGGLCVALTMPEGAARQKTSPA